MKQNKRIIFWLVSGGMAGTFIGLKFIGNNADIFSAQSIGYLAGLLLGYVFGFIYFSLKKAANPLSESGLPLLKQILVIVGFGFLGTLIALLTYSHFINLLISQLFAHSIGIVAANKLVKYKPPVTK